MQFITRVQKNKKNALEQKWLKEDEQQQTYWLSQQVINCNKDLY